MACHFVDILIAAPLELADLLEPGKFLRTQTSPPVNSSDEFSSLDMARPHLESILRTLVVAIASTLVASAL